MARRTVKNLTSKQLKMLSPAARERAERQIEKAHKTGDYKPPTNRRCKYDERYSCTPEKCPPIRYTATKQELKQCARKTSAPFPFSKTEGELNG